jgi:transcriptional regulator GlxA family with amidase domain
VNRSVVVSATELLEPCFLEEWTRSVAYHQRIRAALEFALPTPSRIVSLGEVADHVGMEKTAFCRYFRSKVGATFTGVLRVLRVRFAANLLRSQDYGIGEVAARTGFDSLTTFGRCFRAYYTVAPRDYRREHVPQPAQPDIAS